MHTEQLIHELSNGLIGWYPFYKGFKALYISDDTRDFETWIDILRGKELNVQVLALKEVENQMQEESPHCYDYIIISTALEHSRNPRALLSMLRKLLSDHGRLLAVANNRFGIRYFCGDKDVYTGHVLDSIDNYAKVSTKRKEEIGGRSYSKAELKDMLSEAGFTYQKFYSVMPSILRPQVLISEDYIPNEALDIRVFPQYQSPQTVFLEEEKLYEDFLKMGCSIRWQMAF